MTWAQGAAVDAADDPDRHCPGSSNERGPAPLRILTFTSLFPNSEQPLHGLFVRERIRALSMLCHLRVVAPVPWAPPIPGLGPRYAGYRRVRPDELDGGAQVHHPRFFVVPKALKHMDGAMMAYSCLAAIRRIRKEFPFDLIDAHWAYPDGVAAGMIAGRLGVPFTITVRGDDINIFAEESSRGPLIRSALRRAILVIAVSEDLKRRVSLITDGGARVVVIPNGINADRFKPVDRVLARRQLNLDLHSRVIVSVGRLHESKGFPIVVEALAELGRGFEDVKLFIIGGPDSEADARPAIAAAVARHGLERRVQMTGAQSQEQLVNWYSAADLMCLATGREGSPNVLLEALACGLPCVTTPVGGNREAVSTPELGLLVPPDPGATARGLADALTRKWDRPGIAARARRRTWTTVAEECRQHLVQAARAGV